jgi:hypothetical protein
LLARIEALLRRGNLPDVTTRIRIADLELDLLGRKVVRGGKAIDVTSKEFQLLEFLARRAGQAHRAPGGSGRGRGVGGAGTHQGRQREGRDQFHGRVSEWAADCSGMILGRPP